MVNLTSFCSEWRSSALSALALTSALSLAVACGNVVTTPDPGPGKGTNIGGAGGGSLYGLSEDESGPALVRLDPDTGAVTKVASLPPPGFSGYGAIDAVLDPNRHRYSYVGTDANDGTERLVTVDFAVGAVIADVPLSDRVWSLGLDEATGRLLCHVALTSPPDAMTVNQIDPMTGAFTPLATYQPGAVFVAGPGYMVFDGANTYYGVAAGSLLSVDTNTGGLTQKALSATPTGVQFDGPLSRLVALDYGEPKSIVAIDPATAAVTSLAKLPGFDHALADDATYDPATHRYFFIGGSSFPQGGSMWHAGNQIVTVDTDHGQVLASPTVATTTAVYNIRFAP